MLLATVLQNQNKTILSRNYEEYCQCLHPGAESLEWHSILFHEKQCLAGTSCMLPRFPSLAKTDYLAVKVQLDEWQKRALQSHWGVVSAFPV